MLSDLSIIPQAEIEAGEVRLKSRLRIAAGLWSLAFAAVLILTMIGVRAAEAGAF